MGLGFGVRGGLLGGSWHHHSTTESRGWLLAPPFHHRVSPFHHHSTPKSRHSTTIPPQSVATQSRAIPPPFHPKVSPFHHHSTLGGGVGVVVVVVVGVGLGFGVGVGLLGGSWASPGRLGAPSWCSWAVFFGFPWFFLGFVWFSWLGELRRAPGPFSWALGLGPGAPGLASWAASWLPLGGSWAPGGASWLPLGGPRAGNPQNCDSLAFLLGKWRQFLTVLGETSGAYFRPATWVGSRDPAEPWVVFFGVNSTQPEVREAGGNFALL